MQYRLRIRLPSGKSLTFSSDCSDDSDAYLKVRTYIFTNSSLDASDVTLKSGFPARPLTGTVENNSTITVVRKARTPTNNSANNSAKSTTNVRLNNTSSKRLPVTNISTSATTKRRRTRQLNQHFKRAGNAQTLNGSTQAPPSAEAIIFGKLMQAVETRPTSSSNTSNMSRGQPRSLSSSSQQDASRTLSSTSQQDASRTLSSNTSQQDASVSSLKNDFQTALLQQYEITKATRRIASVLRKKYTIKEDASQGRLLKTGACRKLHITFYGETGVGSKKKDIDIVDNISKEMLIAVLKDQYMREKELVRPITISERSARLFWALVKHFPDHHDPWKMLSTALGEDISQARIEKKSNKAERNSADLAGIKTQIEEAKEQLRFMKNVFKDDETESDGYLADIIGEDWMHACRGSNLDMSVKSWALDMNAQTLYDELQLILSNFSQGFPKNWGRSLKINKGKYYAKSLVGTNVRVKWVIDDQNGKVEPFIKGKKMKKAKTKFFSAHVVDVVDKELRGGKLDNMFLIYDDGEQSWVDPELFTIKWDGDMPPSVDVLEQMGKLSKIKDLTMEEVENWRKECYKVLAEHPDLM